MQIPCAELQMLQMHHKVGLRHFLKREESANVLNSFYSHFLVLFNFYSQNDKCTALHFAATQGATDILKLMMTSYKGDEPIIDALDGNKETLLHR